MLTLFTLLSLYIPLLRPVLCFNSVFITRRAKIMATAISIKDFKDQSTSCGELACQKDSMLRVLATRVLACSKRVEIPEKTSSGGKGGRNGKGKGKEIKALEPKKTRGDLFDVLLEDTRQ